MLGNDKGAKTIREWIFSEDMTSYSCCLSTGERVGGESIPDY